MPADPVWTDPRFPGVSCRRVGPESLEMLLSLKSSLERDYLAEVLPDWLQDRPGGVYAYYFEDRLCGLCSIHIPRPGEAWLRGKRIAVGFEGKGIGTASAVFEMEEARRLGARVARLITEVGNAAVHRMMREKLGYTDAARWWVSDAPVFAAPDPATGAPASTAVAPGGASGTGAGPAPVTVLRPEDWAPGALPTTLAVLEPLLARHAAAAGGGGEGPGYGRWGLWATLDDPYTLAGFGPEELVEAVRAGSVLAVSGPPGAPTGLALLSPGGGWGLILRLFVTSGAAAAAGLGAWLRSRNAPRLTVSLPVDHAAALFGVEPEALVDRGGTLFVLYQRELQ